jgi:hypothetical protein
MDVAFSVGALAHKETRGNVYTGLYIYIYILQISNSKEKKK